MGWLNCTSGSDFGIYRDVTIKTKFMIQEMKVSFLRLTLGLG